MNKKLTKFQLIRLLFGAAVSDIEIVFVFVMPIYLYGWKAGLLVGSGLTSLMHIVQILGRIEKAKEKA